MHSRTLVRTTSAPSLLVVPRSGGQAATQVSPQQQAHETLLRELATWRGGEDFTPADDVLWQALLHHAEHGDVALDLRECRIKVLNRAPEKVMQVFADFTALRQPPLARMRFPSGLSCLPPWIRHFQQLEVVCTPHVRGRRLDMSMLPHLKRVELEKIRWPGVRVQVPNHAVVIDHECDKDLHVAEQVTPSGECHVTLRWHNFNLATTIAGTQQKIACRHIALTTLVHWAGLDWAHATVDHMDPAALVWIQSEAQLSASVSSKAEDVYCALALRPAKAFIVGFDKWADFLEVPRERLLAHGSPVFALLHTTTHVMPVVFVLAPDKSMAIIALDPNFSQEATICTKGENLTTLFPRFHECRGSYFARNGEWADATAYVKITFIDDPARPQGSTTAKYGNVSSTFAGLPRNWHKELVREFIVTGTSEGLDMLTTQIELGVELPKDVLGAVVAGRDDAISLPWMHAAAEAGQKHVMTAWGRCLAAAFHHGLISSEDVLYALNLQRMNAKTLLSTAIASNHSGFVQCFTDVLLHLAHAKAIKPADVYKVLSLNGKADATFIDLVRSRKMVRCLQKAWDRLHKAGALSDSGYEHLQDSLKQVSWKKRLL
jgi:hypothetical protein